MALQQRNHELEAKVSQLEEENMAREQAWQAAAQKRLQESIQKRDAHWQSSIQRLQKEGWETEQQKEAAEASTSVGTTSRRGILLALSREKQKSDSQSQEVK